MSGKPDLSPRAARGLAAIREGRVRYNHFWEMWAGLPRGVSARDARRLVTLGLAEIPERDPGPDPMVVVRVTDDA